MTAPKATIFLPGLALLLSLTASTPAQENQELGRMWTFENPPLADLDEEYGFKPDQEWLLDVGALSKPLPPEHFRQVRVGSADNEDPRKRGGAAIECGPGNIK